MEKACFKCGAVKPLDGFYTHPAMGDGHLGKCKDCTKRDAQVNRQTNPRVRQYDRERASRPERVALRKKVGAEWAEKHPERRRASNRANNAVRDGVLTRGTKCQLCGATPDRIEKHHPDYARPLLVVWVCKTCHAVADKLRRAIEAHF